MTPSTKAQKRTDAIFRLIQSYRGIYERIPHHIREQVWRTFLKLSDQDKIQISRFIDETYPQGHFQQWLGTLKN